MQPFEINQRRLVSGVNSPVEGQSPTGVDISRISKVAFSSDRSENVKNRLSSI